MDSIILREPPSTVSEWVSFALLAEGPETKGLACCKCLCKIEGMKYGYARVSTDDQTPALQLAALKKAGCKTIFKDDGLSGATTKRPALLLRRRPSSGRALSGTLIMSDQR